MKNYEAHELSKIIPKMSDDEYQKLKLDIRENGFDEERPIYLFEDKILDGRHRYQACKELKVEPEFKEFKGESAVIFVISANIHRRHLTASQLAVIGNEMLPQLEEEAKKRQKLSDGRGIKGSEKVHHLKEDQGKSAEHAARLVGVNSHYIHDAKKLKEEHGDLYDDVREGTKTLQEAKREVAKSAYKDKILKVSQDKVSVPKEKYRCIVVDPPWPLKGNEE